MFNVQKLKISPKNILLESIAMILIVLGVEKIQISFYSKEYEALFEMNNDKLDQLGVRSISELIIDAFWWGFGAFILVSLLIGIIKLWKNRKKRLLDTLLAFIIVFILFPIGFFNSGIIHGIINLVGGLFSDEIRIRMLITGLFWTLVGFAIIWYGINNTIQNKAYS